MSKLMLRERESFAGWLRDELRAHRMTQTQFEREIMVSQGMVSHWVNANRTPSPKSMKKIADYFGKEMDYLNTLAGYREPTEEISNEYDPRLDMNAKIKQIQWTPEREHLTLALLDSLLNWDRNGSAPPVTVSPIRASDV